MMPWFIEFLLLLLAAFVLIPFVPSMVEYRRRRDKGPRAFPETTIVQETPDFEARGESPPSAEGLSFVDKSQIKPVGDLIHILGNVTIPENTNVDGPLIIEGSLNVGRNSKINGSVKVSKNLTIEENGIIMGHCVCGGDVIVGPSARIEGMLDTEGDIVLHENAFLGGASADKSIRIEPGAKVGKKLSAGELIITETTHTPMPVAGEKELTAGEPTKKRNQAK